MAANLSVARHRRIDVRPRIDAAGQVKHVLEAIAREVHRDLRAAHAMMAHYDGLAIGVELRKPRRNIGHRDVQRAVDRRRRGFPWLADVENEWPVAVVETLLQFNRFNFGKFSHRGLNVSQSSVYRTDS